MGSKYTAGGGNVLWQDYADTLVYASGAEIMRIDVAQTDSQRIVVRPVTDFATPGGTATGQWSLDGARWEPCPYYDPALGTFTGTGVFALGANKPLIFADLGNYFRIIVNQAGGFAAPAQPNIIAGLTGDDGIVFGASSGGGGGGGGAVTAADGALVTIGTTTDAATASGTNTTLVGALRAIRDSTGPTSASVYAGTGAATLVGILKGVYALLAGVLLFRMPPVTVGANTAAASSRVLKGSAGSLSGLNVVTGATAGYIMLFDSITPPADGAVTPTWVLPIGTNTGYSGSPSGSDAEMAFGTGITAVFSSTGPFTKTASATAFIAGSVR